MTLINRNITIGNHRTYLKMFWRYATSNGINGDRNMIREAFDYKVETGTGKRNFTRGAGDPVGGASRN